MKKKNLRSEAAMRAGLKWLKKWGIMPIYRVVDNDGIIIAEFDLRKCVSLRKPNKGIRSAVKALKKATR